MTILFTVRTSHSFTIPFASQDATVSPWTERKKKNNERDALQTNDRKLLVDWMLLDYMDWHGQRTCAQPNPEENRSLGDQDTFVWDELYRASIPQHQRLIDGTGENDIGKHQQFRWMNGILMSTHHCSTTKTRMTENSVRRWLSASFLHKPRTNLFKSHSRTVLSWEAEAMKSPHEWKLTDQTKTECPRSNELQAKADIKHFTR